MTSVSSRFGRRFIDMIKTANVLTFVALPWRARWGREREALHDGWGPWEKTFGIR